MKGKVLGISAGTLVVLGLLVVGFVLWRKKQGKRIIPADLVPAP